MISEPLPLRGILYSIRSFACLSRKGSSLTWRARYNKPFANALNTCFMMSFMKTLVSKVKKVKMRMMTVQKMMKQMKRKTRNNRMKRKKKEKIAQIVPYTSPTTKITTYRYKCLTKVGFLSKIKTEVFWITSLP
jgi:hypothetical protein